MYKKTRQQHGTASAEKYTKASKPACQAIRRPSLGKHNACLTRLSAVRHVHTTNAFGLGPSGKTANSIGGSLRTPSPVGTLDMQVQER